MSQKEKAERWKLRAGKAAAWLGLARAEVWDGMDWIWQAGWGEPERLSWRALQVGTVSAQRALGLGARVGARALSLGMGVLMAGRGWEGAAEGLKAEGGEFVWDASWTSRELAEAASLGAAVCGAGLLGAQGQEGEPQRDERRQSWARLAEAAGMIQGRATIAILEGPAAMIAEAEQAARAFLSEAPEGSRVCAILWAQGIGKESEEAIWDASWVEASRSRAERHQMSRALKSWEVALEAWEDQSGESLSSVRDSVWGVGALRVGSSPWMARRWPKGEEGPGGWMGKSGEPKWSSAEAIRSRLEAGELSRCAGEPKGESKKRGGAL